MKRSFVFLLPLTLGIFGLTSGCSDDDPGATEASVDRESFPQQAAEAFCENVADCCTEAGIDQDIDTCVENATATIEGNLATSEEQEVAYDGTHAAACLSSAKAYAKCGLTTDKDVEAYLSSCGALFKGTLKAGATCADDVECAGEHAACRKADILDATGICVELDVRAHGKSGDDCAATCSGTGALDTCTFDPSAGDEITTGCYLSQNLWCNDGTCEPLGDVGDGWPFGCKDNLFCDGDACATKRTEGQPCSVTDFGACEDGTLCDGDSNECVALRPAGAVCDTNEDCESRACHGGVCAINSATELSCSGLNVTLL